MPEMKKKRKEWMDWRRREKEVVERRKKDRRDKDRWMGRRKEGDLAISYVCQQCK